MSCPSECSLHRTTLNINPQPPCASGALILPQSSAFGSAIYLNMSFNAALEGSIPAALQTTGIFNTQVRSKCLMQWHANKLSADFAAYSEHHPAQVPSQSSCHGVCCRDTAFAPDMRA